MTLVKRVTGLPFRFGGEEHSGWLPSGAAKPLPTPTEDVLLDVEIDAIPGGFLLYWKSQDGERFGDTWHRSIAEAEAEASRYFGIRQDQWELVV